MRFSSFNRRRVSFNCLPAKNLNYSPFLYHLMCEFQAKVLHERIKTVDSWEQRGVKRRKIPYKHHIPVPNTLFYLNNKILFADLTSRSWASRRFYTWPDIWTGKEVRIDFRLNLLGSIMHIATLHSIDLKNRIISNLAKLVLDFGRLEQNARRLVWIFTKSVPKQCHFECSPKSDTSDDLQKMPNF